LASLKSNVNEVIVINTRHGAPIMFRALGDSITLPKEYRNWESWPAIQQLINNKKLIFEENEVINQVANQSNQSQKLNPIQVPEIKIPRKRGRARKNDASRDVSASAS